MQYCFSSFGLQVYICKENVIVVFPPGKNENNEEKDLICFWFYKRKFQKR